MPTTTQIAGKFLYAADVIPKGNRNPRRVLMNATALFEIATAGQGDVETDALVVETGRKNEPVSYALHEGRLYRPATAARGRPMPLDLYRQMLARWPSLPHVRAPDPTNLALHADPIVHSYGGDDVHQWPDIRDPDEKHKEFQVFAEEEFQGRILSSDRDVALRRYERAARHVLLIGDEVHYRAIEPMWWVSTVGVRLFDLSPGFQRHDYYQPEPLGRGDLHDVFALDRMDDAKAWFAERHGTRRCQVEGEVLRPSSGYQPEPALARPLHGVIGPILRATEHNRDYLGADSYAAWGRLRRAAASIEPYDLGELGRDPAALVAEVVSIMEDLEGRFLPKAAERYGSDVKDDSSMLRERARFERARKPTLSEEDDHSIAAANGMSMSAGAA